MSGRGIAALLAIAALALPATGAARNADHGSQNPTANVPASLLSQAQANPDESFQVIVEGTGNLSSDSLAQNVANWAAHSESRLVNAANRAAAALQQNQATASTLSTKATQATQSAGLAHAFAAATANRADRTAARTDRAAAKAAAAAAAADAAAAAKAAQQAAAAQTAVADAQATDSSAQAAFGTEADSIVHNRLKDAFTAITADAITLTGEQIVALASHGSNVLSITPDLPVTGADVAPTTTTTATTTTTTATTTTAAPTTTTPATTTPATTTTSTTTTPATTTTSTPAVTVPAITVPAVTTPVITTPAITTPAVTTPVLPKVAPLPGDPNPVPDSSMWPATSDLTPLWHAAPQAPAIAIVDSGVDASKVADFGSRVVASVDLSSLDPNKTGDQEGHGTMVAGIAAGAASKHPGVAQNAPIVDVHTASASGESLTSDVIAACGWILANKAKYNIRVANFSMAGSTPTSFQYDPLDQAVESLWFNGIVVVAAAGNQGTGSPVDMSAAPGNDPFVITVGAVDQNGTADPSDDTVPSWSAYGYTADGMSKPDIAAPGRYMVAPVPMNSTLATTAPSRIVAPGYMWMSGTSFAAPVVSGAAAQILALHPSWTPDQVKGALMLTAAYLPDVDWQPAGVGEVDADSAATLPFTPPNPNENLDTFVSTSPTTGQPAFNAAAWSSAVKSSAAWSSAAWSSAAWSSAAWNSAAWSSAAWSSAAWSSATQSAMQSLASWSSGTLAP